MRDALIVWGGWSGHEPEACAHVVRDWLERDGFRVHVEPSTEAFADPGLGEMALIVPMVTMGTIEKEEIAGLCRAVEAGTGLAGFHGQMADSFRTCVEYQFMVGGQWVAHPGKFVDYRVEVTRPDDPVMRGIDSFDWHSEQYYMHVDPSIEVLASTRFSGAHCAWIDGVEMPVVWKRRHGAGRVFHCTLGHVAEELSRPPLETILRRGFAWAARD